MRKHRLYTSRLLLFFLAIAGWVSLALTGDAEASPAAPDGAPALKNLTLSATTLGPNDTLTLTYTFTDSDGATNIDRAWAGFSNCTVDPGAAYNSNFERNFANYFGALVYSYTGSYSYQSAQVNTGAACADGLNGFPPWVATAPYENATGTTELLSVTRSVSGNDLTLTYTVKLKNHPAGTFALYYMVRDKSTTYQNGTTTAQWKKTTRTITVAQPPTPTPSSNLPPSLQSVSISPNPANPGDKLTIKLVYADPDGSNTIRQVLFGFNNCPESKYNTGLTYFEHNLANFFGLNWYTPAYGGVYSAAGGNNNAACSNLLDTVSPLWVGSPYNNAYGSARITSFSYAFSGNTVTVDVQVQLKDFPDGTYNLYYAVNDKHLAFQGSLSEWWQVPNQQLVVLPSYVEELKQINDFRALANLPAVTSNQVWSNGNIQHSRYMLKNNLLTHSQSTTNQWYTLEGAAAGQSSLVLASSSAGTTDPQAIIKWMTSPFHALGILEPRLTQVGYGSYREAAASGSYQMAAGLDVFRGIDYFAAASYPVFFPANGKTLSISRYVGGATPDPLSPCPGYTVPTGPPILVQFGSGSSSPTNLSNVSLLKDGASVPHCVYNELTYTNPNPQHQSNGRSILGSQDAVVIIPRSPLTAGAAYQVNMSVNGTTYSWSFTVAASPGGNVVAQVLSPLPDEASAAAVPANREQICQQAIGQALPPGHGLAFDGGWTLTGVSGEMQRWRPSGRLGVTLDLLKVYYRDPEGVMRQTWTVAGAELPAYFGVHDTAGYEYYQQHVGSEQPYYVSFVAGASNFTDLKLLFARPGQQQIRLSVAGDFVSEQAIAWERCQPQYDHACILPRFFDPLYSLSEHGVSTAFVHNGIAPAHPMYGFLAWPLHIEATLDVCQPVSLPKERYVTPR